VTPEEQVAALRAEADRLESRLCTGVAATWCPVHGNCSCALDPNTSVRMLDDPTCPLHAAESSHAEASLQQFEGLR
jgi:hypothetical protein